MRNTSNNRSNRRDNTPKACFFCANNIEVIDYKDIILLRKFINTAGKILPRKKTGTCAKHQRLVARSIKQSRIVGLLPFVAK
jgi:small subunit ribosomal protein S18